MSARGEQIGVSDHALLRLFERAAGLDIEQLRARLSNSLARAHDAARSITESDYLIKADGLLYVVRGNTCVTVLADDHDFASADALRHDRGPSYK